VTPNRPQPVAAAAAQPQGGARWLAEALHSLRTDHAPGAALALLDGHAVELRQSAFVHEAMLLRVEALLSLRRSDEALELLDGKALSNLAASRTLLLTRAELRAAAGRCTDSLTDFDLLLARAQRPDEQALYGRAVCRDRTGDKRGARADLELYQRRFPNGAHIREVEKQLAGSLKSTGPVP
jgi:outer membrane PBP1 activator LpoA protein